MFGFYTPTLRTTDLIPGQVRLLRSMLAGREDDVLRVILADDRSGTLRPAGGASPSGEPKPAKTPKPDQVTRTVTAAACPPADSVAPGVW